MKHGRAALSRWLHNGHPRPRLHASRPGAAPDVLCSLDADGGALLSSARTTLRILSALFIRPAPGVYFRSRASARWCQTKRSVGNSLGCCLATSNVTWVHVENVSLSYPSLGVRAVIERLGFLVTPCSLPRTSGLSEISPRRFIDRGTISKPTAYSGLFSLLAPESCSSEEIKKYCCLCDVLWYL